jgi:hypothetical protein
MKNPDTILRALLAFALLGWAQAAPERTCRIVFPDRPQDAPRSLHLFDGKQSQEVELPSMNLSPVYGLAPGAIQLKLLNAKVGSPKDVPADAPSVEVAADCADLILLVSSDPDNKTAAVKMELVDLGSENFKTGQTLWANHSDKTIEAKLGAQTVSLEPESSKIVDAPLSENGVAASGYYTATFTYQAQPDAAPEPITEQQWWHDANSRHLGFIVNTGGKLPKIYFYRDFRAPQE